MFEFLLRLAGQFGGGASEFGVTAQMDAAGTELTLATCDLQFAMAAGVLPYAFAPATDGSLHRGT